MTIFDLLQSASIKLAKMFKKGKLTEQQYRHFSVKLSNFTDELYTTLGENDAANGEESN